MMEGTVSKTEDQIKQMTASGPNAFTRYVKRSKAAPPPLPVIHTTNALCLREIVEEGRMTPQPCDVFTGEDLLYFFYGKPSYRLFADFDSALTAEAPVALILSGALVTESKRLFPFDSGGFDRYKKFMPKQFKLPHFELEHSTCEPGQIVTTFFRSNSEYFDGQPRPDLTIPADQFEAESFFQLLKYKGREALDDRAWTIELQIPKAIPLDKTTVLSVVMPDILVDTDLGEIISKKWDVLPLTYNLTGRGKPSDYHATIRGLTRDFLEAKGFL